MKKSRAKQHWLDLSNSQRKGILVLFLLTLCVMAYFVFVRFQPKNYNFDSILQDEEVIRLQHQIDSIAKNKEEASKKPKIYPFNPNFLTDYRGYQLGMSSEEIDRMIQFRATDQWVNSVEEFQQVTNVSDSLLKEIQVYFKFPEFAQKQQAKANTSKVVAHLPKKDLNDATFEELIEIKGIGEVLGKRIIHQRNRLGGYLDLIQLKDVWGLKYEVRQELEQRYFVTTPKEFEKLDINTINVIDLSELPYFDYELAREVINFRQLNQGIDDFDDLAKIQDFPYHKIDRIKLYLVINK